MGNLADATVSVVVGSRLFQVGLYLAVGWMVRRLGIISRDSVSELSSLIFKVMFPAVIFSALVGTTRTLTFVRLLTPAVSLVWASLCLTGILAYQKVRDLERNPSVAVTGTLGNTAYLGVPLSAALFGPAGGAVAALFDFGITLAMWTIGAYLLARYRPNSFGPEPAWAPTSGLPAEQVTAAGQVAAAGQPAAPGWRRLVRDLVNPNTVALALGLIIGKSPVAVPGPLLGAIEGLAATALPMAMLVVGAMIAGAHPFSAGSPGLWRKLALGGVAKLALGPALAYALTRLLGLSGLTQGVIVLQAAMPTMASTPVYLRHFQGDEDLGAAAVLVTTILCFATIPLVLRLLV